MHCSMEHLHTSTVARTPSATQRHSSQYTMLSPNSITSRRASRAPSTCSVDSGYGPGNGDKKFGCVVSVVLKTALLFDTSANLMVISLVHVTHHRLLRVGYHINRTSALGSTECQSYQLEMT